MLELRENLYLGNINAAAEVLEGGNKEITHILSVLTKPSIAFFSEWKPGFSVPAKNIRTVYNGQKIHYVLENAGRDLKLVRLAVPLRDTENENLLDYLDVCLDFIDQGRKNGSVLVHCFAGISRSASIITAYLMRTERLSLKDALESLRQSNAYVCPNDGFLEQLAMFEDMGFKVDHSSPTYKRFRWKVLGPGKLLRSWILAIGNSLLQWVLTMKNNLLHKVCRVRMRKSDCEIRPLLAPSGKKDLSQASGLTDTEASILTETTLQKEIVPMAAFCCKNCRRIVALQGEVINHIHEEGEGESSLRNNCKNFNKCNELECTSVFVEPLRWMKTVEEGASEGKLWCKHCEEQLGYFNWSGIQCSCGSWIKPAFQLHKSRIDLSTD